MRHGVPKEMARRAGVNVALIYAWAHGRVKRARYATALKFAEAFGVDPVEFALAPREHVLRLAEAVELPRDRCRHRLCELAGIDETLLCKLLYGQRRMSPSSAKALAPHLGVEARDLMGRTPGELRALVDGWGGGEAKPRDGMRAQAEPGHESAEGIGFRSAVGQGVGPLSHRRHGAGSGPTAAGAE